jgi:hypothetical protein
VSQLIYAVRFGCDVCGAEGETADRTTLTGSNAAPPPGWMDLYATHLVLQTPHGMPLMHLCDRCSRMPVRDLPGALAEAQARREAAR